MDLFQNLMILLSRFVELSKKRSNIVTRYECNAHWIIWLTIHSGSTTPDVFVLTCAVDSGVVVAGQQTRHKHM